MAKTKAPPSPSAALAALLQKRFGSTSAMTPGGRTAGQITEVIPTGIEVVDYYLLGVGGLPVGRMSELYGPEASGKSTLAYAFLVAVQRLGGLGVLADPEHSFDDDRFRQLGGDPDALLILEPEHMEMLLEQIKAVLTAHNPKTGPMLIVWDTLAATPTQYGKTQEAGKSKVGDAPLLLSNQLKLILPLLACARAHLLIVNQIRDKIGVMFGDATTTPGGHAVKFYASWRAQFFGGKAVKLPDGTHVGKDVTLLVTKTRLSAPFRKVRLRLMYATGYANQWSTLEHAKTRGVIPKLGAGSKGAKAHAAALAKLGWRAGFTDTVTPALPAELVALADAVDLDAEALGEDDEDAEDEPELATDEEQP
jgi:recombination protein RecA